LRDLRIWPTDTGDDDQNSKPIEVLIGAETTYRRQPINWTTAHLAMHLVAGRYIFELDYEVLNTKAHEDAAS